jgi:hypothetical protein
MVAVVMEEPRAQQVHDEADSGQRDGLVEHNGDRVG